MGDSPADVRRRTVKPRPRHKALGLRRDDSEPLRVTQAGSLSLARGVHGRSLGSSLSELRLRLNLKVLTFARAASTVTLASSQAESSDSDPTWPGRGRRRGPFNGNSRPVHLASRLTHYDRTGPGRSSDHGPGLAAAPHSAGGWLGSGVLR